MCGDCDEDEDGTDDDVCARCIDTLLYMMVVEYGCSTADDLVDDGYACCWY